MLTLSRDQIDVYQRARRVNLFGLEGFLKVRFGTQDKNGERL
jgi:hypothetical protein